MVNKRSESANRKYRAFKNFIKYHNNNNKPVKKFSDRKIWQFKIGESEVNKGKEAEVEEKT